MNTKDLLEMELHEERKITDYVYVFRVVGGWIYINNDFNTTVSQFVPEPKNTGFIYD